MGNINATNGTVGGIVGQNTNLLKNCYNLGTVYSEGNYVGGISGLNWTDTNEIKADIQNCYNAGNINNKNGAYLAAVAVTSGYGTESNLYYLYGTCSESWGATVKTDSELKNLAEILGSEFKTNTTNNKNGYPLLKWE